MSTVRLEQLTKRYDGKLAISDLNLTCEDGEFVVILGRPGAGKTTTLKMIAGVEEATSGNIYLGVNLVNRLPPEKRNVAMAFESYALYPHWSVRENLEFPLRAPGRNLSPEERTARIKRVTDLLEISHLLDRRPNQLSGGQRQRVSLGRALVRNANATLLDEPIAHLDARLRHALRGELKHYQREQEATTIYTTPDYLEATGIADRIAVLIEGGIRQFASPTEVYDAPADLDVALMVGDPKMNVFEVDTDARTIRLDGAKLSVPGLKEGVQHIGIRPNDIRISTSEVEGAIAGNVYVSEPMGYEQVIRVQAGGNIINVKAPLEVGIFQIGQHVWLVPDWRSIHMFDQEGRRVKGGRQ